GDLLPRDAVRGTTSNSYEVTPDGKYLFGMTSLAQLVRWQITGNLLKLDITGPAIATGAGGQVVVSADGKYVCLLHPEGNQTTASDHPLLERYGTYVYGVKNLGRPEFALAQGKGLSVLAFDGKTGQVYSNNASSPLLRFGPTGIRQQSYALEGGATRQVLVHPDGRKLLVLTESKLYETELGSEGG